MKKILSSTIALLVCLTVAAKDVTIESVRYTILGNNTVRCAAANKNKIVDLVIPAKITVDGLPYAVTEVEKEGFKGCKNLRSVVLPNSINTIGEAAFWNCKALESAVMPDDCQADISKGSYGYDRYGIFHGCKALKRLRGTTRMYPDYFLLNALFDCPDVPVYATIHSLDDSQRRSATVNARFLDFAVANIKKPVEEWQRRKMYETMAQWEARVTDANRSRMIEEATAEARAEFIKTFAPMSIKGVLEDYNADYGFYSVYLGELGNVYAAVPADEAKNFADNWDKVSIEPVYGILDNSVGILSCKFILGDKTYTSPSSYNEDDFTDIALTIVPLASVREYELAAAKRTEIKEEQRTYETDIIDIDIPGSEADNTRTFAVIIGNENYQRVAHVDYAMNDARIFAKYCERTLGIPESNIRTYYDATFGDILAAMDDVKNITDAFSGDVNVIFYYAGHGMPDESNRNAFLIPIDATGTQPEACYPLNRLYAQLGELKANSVVAFIDACFSGSLRGDGMLASARGIKIKPRDVPAEGNLVVLSAASGDQTAFPYHEKGHGLFSYYLIKKLNESKGEATLGEIADYVTSNVSQQAVVVNKKPQTPGVKSSANMGTTWRDLMLRPKK